MNYTNEAIELLKKLISTPSISSKENATANILTTYVESKGVKAHRIKNNVWAFNKGFTEGKPTILLNSHHDTVQPNPGYTRDPFAPTIENGVLYGLGSNDAGASLVSLLATFLTLNEQLDLPYNLIWAASAEEETTGDNGIGLLISQLPRIDFGIVGEPSKMEMAIAEKGLFVLDCTTHGTSGHAAREEGVNAFYKALDDIEWFRSYKFTKISDVLGPVKMTVTQINSGVQSNVVPKECKFVVDVRVNELYKNQQVLETIRQNVSCDLVPRNMKMSSSGISLEHPIITRGIALGRPYYGSPTTSDKALMNFETLKMGPGDSARSHTADEYILLSEIKDGIALYVDFLKELKL